MEDSIRSYRSVSEQEKEDSEMSNTSETENGLG